MISLYELSEQYLILLDAIANEQEPEAFSLALTQIKDEITAKVENIGKFIFNLEAEHEAIGNEIERLKHKQQLAFNKTTSLKNYLLTELTALNMNKLKTPLFNVSVRTAPPSVQVLDENRIPAEYMRVIPAQLEVDKKAIIQYWRSNNGENLPGVAIVADKKFVVIK